MTGGGGLVAAAPGSSLSLCIRWVLVKKFSFAKLESLREEACVICCLPITNVDGTVVVVWWRRRSPCSAIRYQQSACPQKQDGRLNDRPLPLIAAGSLKIKLFNVWTCTRWAPPTRVRTSAINIARFLHSFFGEISIRSTYNWKLNYANLRILSIFSSTQALIGVYSLCS